MKKTLVATLALCLLLTSPAYAADPAPPQCVEDKIAVEKLKQENSKLQQLLMQAQFQASKQAEDSAKAEQTRLENLLPKKPDENPKKASATEKK